MMVFFPEMYEDELAYSLFAKYHVHAGHLTFRATAEDLFTNNMDIVVYRPKHRILNAKFGTF